MLSFGISAHNLQGPFPIAGQPINHPEVWVNGVHKLQTHLAFLSFSDLQNMLLSSIVHLNAGDVCTFKYNLKYIDPVTGEQPYPGTMELIGVMPNYTQDTFMAVHYLSSDHVEFEPCEMGSPFDICKPCVPPCCPCTMQKPHCDVDCHSGGHCGDHHGQCGDHNEHGSCDDHDDHGGHGHGNGHGDCHDDCDDNHHGGQGHDDWDDEDNGH